MFTHADVLLSVLVPQVVRHVQGVLVSSSDAAPSNVFLSNPASEVWLKMMQTIKDPYAVERLSEQLLHCLAKESLNDIEAYWILWLLFNQSFRHELSVRLVYSLSLFFLKSSEGNLGTYGFASKFGLMLLMPLWHYQQK